MEHTQQSMFVTSKVLCDPISDIHCTNWPIKEVSLPTGKLVCIRGTAIQVSPARPVAVSLNYTCSKCRASIPVQCPDGRPVAPKACADACKSRAFQVCDCAPASAARAEYERLHFAASAVLVSLHRNEQEHDARELRMADMKYNVCCT